MESHSNSPVGNAGFHIVPGVADDRTVSVLQDLPTKCNASLSTGVYQMVAVTTSKNHSPPLSTPDLHCLPKHSPDHHSPSLTTPAFPCLPQPCLLTSTFPFPSQPSPTYPNPSVPTPALPCPPHFSPALLRLAPPITYNW